ncbi:hypothetical protein JCGZ_20887 [Jatropha curcas]|uniref:Uncharacterized protein n=1 Tax=Jatropha curcas TaxID=180498 RepID=A0A067L639_JATCU|nr:hypothetical protein JCGZ_20887 [Jatropha curcas]
MLSFPRTTNPYMARQTVLSVLGKILNLLIQESDSLLEFEDQFQCIEAQLRKHADWLETPWFPYVLIEIIYDTEDLIDELIIRSAQRRSREAIIRCILSLVDLPRQFFYVLALIDLTDSYRFYKKLKLIEINVSRTFGLACGSGSWHNTFSPYDLEIGTTIVSPVISKFEALASKRQLRPAVRKQARWLRDEFKCLKAFLKDLESRETLSERGMAWTEELCDVCRSTENVVGLFLTKNEKGNPKSLVWSPRNFISQRNLVQQMARIQVKVSDISKRIYEAMHQRTWHTDRFPSITPPTATPEQLDIDMVCFEEDVDAVIKQLLKDDPRCLTISIVGQDIGNFLDRCISSNCFHFLWVLDLENVYKPKLPKAVGQLIHLRYLGLRSTYLEMLPMFIDKLLNLQTLDLKRTCINTIPITIWKMQKLRHLFLDESFCSTFIPQQEHRSSVELQTFWGAFINENSPVKNGLDSWLSIRKLALKCKLSVPSQKAAMSLQLFNIADWVVNLKHLQSLRLKSFDESGQPWDVHLQSLSGNVELSDIYLVGKLRNQDLISNFPQSLTEVTLSASGLIEDPMQTLEKLPKLRIVGLFSKSFSGKKMLCKDGGFPKLEVLKLWELELLEEWNMEKGAMPSLKHLEIRHCINLKMLPDALRSIDTLREVKLTKLPMLSSSLKDKQNEDLNKIAHVRLICIED